MSASGTITPWPETRPQRSARCQKQRAQAAVDAGQLRDRLGGGEADRALAEAVEQHGGDLGIAGQLDREVAVEDGDGDRREHRPHRLDGQQARPVARLPGPDHVAGAEQLGAHLVGDDELAREHAVEDQQADVVARRAAQARDVPGARGTW